MNRKMNSSTFGIFVVVLFAYNTPTQGQEFTVAKVVFANDEECITNPAQGRNTSLIRLPDNSYEIRETTEAVARVTFEIRDFHTMIWDTVVLATSINTLQIQFHSVHVAQQLFDLTGRNALEWKLYTYDLTAVYEYGKGCILKKGSISGFDTTGTRESNRYIIHTGGKKHKLRAAASMNPYVLWTAYGFNYCVFDERSIVVTLSKPNDKTYSYYLVKFDVSDDLFTWKLNHGDTHSTNIPEAEADPFIISYFRRVYITTD